MAFEAKRIEQIQRVLEKGIEENSFNIDAPAKYARLFFIAFSSVQLRGPMILERDHEDVVQDAEAMFDFLLRSIKRG
jgi:hypothetical protein